LLKVALKHKKKSKIKIENQGWTQVLRKG
jgi:hypothetical protein